MSETDPLLQRLRAILIQRGYFAKDSIISEQMRALLADVAVEYHLGEPYPEWRMSLATDLEAIRERFGVKEASDE